MTALPVETRPDIEILEALDFDVDLTCEIPDCAEINGSVQRAELRVAITCPHCPRTVKCLTCKGCYSFLRGLRRVWCQVCAGPVDPRLYITLLGAIR